MQLPTQSHPTMDTSMMDSSTMSRNNDRLAVVEGLSVLLADTFTLYLTTHNFHWNVTGMMFASLHPLFMTQYTELWNAIDPLAERIRSLGHPAPGSLSVFNSLKNIPDAPLHPPKASQMIEILLRGHEVVIENLRSLFSQAEQQGDQPTADLVTQRLTVHEHTAWMLKALLTE